MVANAAGRETARNGEGAEGPTPQRLFLEQTARNRIAEVAKMSAACSRESVDVLCAYSVKTNPRREMLAFAREAGFFAEVISPDEYSWVRSLGYPLEKMIANGPHVSERSGTDGFPWCTFADSLEAYQRQSQFRLPLYGARLRPSMIDSRFGIPAAEDARLVEAIGALPDGAALAFSFHVRHEDYGDADWRDVAGDVLARAVRFAAQTRRPVRALDIGGSWTPHEFDERFLADVPWLLDRVVAQLPTCRTVIAEPGQAVCTPSEAIVMSVLEVRRRVERCEAIVDAGYPEWPQMHTYVHRIDILRDGEWHPLGPGRDRLGGRTCLEYDLIDGLCFPGDLAPGDRLRVLDAGSYDASMAFAFALGGNAKRL